MWRKAHWRKHLLWPGMQCWRIKRISGRSGKNSENLLEAYRGMDFQNVIENAEPLEKMETYFMLRVLDHIKVFEYWTLMVVFLDGTEIECKNDEE